jgi:hypothetical protein
MIQQREHLNRLAQAHIICEAPAEPELAQEVEPTKSISLIVAKRGTEPAWRRPRRHPREELEPRAYLREAGVDLGRGCRVDDGGEQ